MKAGVTIRDRAAAATELAVLVPVFVLLLGVLIAGGRVWVARAAVAEAAGAAARAASLERSVPEAKVAATRVLDANLDAHGIHCAGRQIEIDATAVTRPPGSPGAVTVTVRCTVLLGDVAAPGLPGSLSADATGRAVVDTYRGR